jgi:hypothetical protein
MVATHAKFESNSGEVRVAGPTGFEPTQAETGKISLNHTHLGQKSSKVVDRGGLTIIHVEPEPLKPKVQLLAL